MQKPCSTSSSKRWQYKLSEPRIFEDPRLSLPVLQELLGDWWRIPNNYRLPLSFGIQSDHKCKGDLCSECSVYKPRLTDLLKFREYAALFDSGTERRCFVLDIHSQNRLIMYRVGHAAVPVGDQDQMAPVKICQKGPDTEPWSRLMEYSVPQKCCSS